MRGDGGVEQRIVLVGVAVSRDGDNDASTAPRRIAVEVHSQCLMSHLEILRCTQRSACDSQNDRNGSRREELNVSTSFPLYPHNRKFVPRSNTSG